MKIYWAGPLFSEAEKWFNEDLAGRLEREGFQVYLPQRDTEQNQTPNDVFHADKAGIDWSDAVVAVCDGPDVDSGTAWEMGYAYDKKPVIALRTDSRMMACSFSGAEEQFNLMLERSADWVVTSISELFEVLRELRILWGGF